jgi:hypothetical protein
MPRDPILPTMMAAPITSVGALSALGVRSFLGHAARWRALLRREYALIYRAGLLDKKGPFEVMLRDKLNNFAHLLSKAGNSEEIFRQWPPASATVGFMSSALGDLRPSSQVVFLDGWAPVKNPPPWAVGNRFFIARRRMKKPKAACSVIGW